MFWLNFRPVLGFIFESVILYYTCFNRSYVIYGYIITPGVIISSFIVCWLY